MFYSMGKLYIFKDKSTIYFSKTFMPQLGLKYCDAACLIDTDGDDEPPLSLTNNTQSVHPTGSIAQPNPHQVEASKG